jgi:hypothetical protein
VNVHEHFERASSKHQPFNQKLGTQSHSPTFKDLTSPANRTHARHQEPKIMYTQGQEENIYIYSRRTPNENKNNFSTITKFNMSSDNDLNTDYA